MADLEYAPFALKTALRRKLSVFSAYVIENDRMRNSEDWIAKYINPSATEPDVVFHNDHLQLGPAHDHQKIFYDEIISCSVRIPDRQKLKAKIAILELKTGTVSICIDGGKERTRDVYIFAGFIGEHGKLMRLSSCCRMHPLKGLRRLTLKNIGATLDMTPFVIKCARLSTLMMS